MKIFHLIPALLAFTAVAAETTTSEQPAPAATTQATTPMAQAIARTTFVTDVKPSTEAKYYMYVCSASWCGPCRMVMPRLVAEYPNMMANKDVEVILLSCDRTPEAARDYMKHYNAPFATLMYTSPEAAAMPGFPNDIVGIPHIVVVDAYGRLLYRGHGLRYKDWKQEIEKAANAQ